MIRARTRHELPCSPERFWELYLDVAFIHRAFVEGLRWAPPKILSVTDDGRIYRRVMEATPNLVLPGPVAKLVNRTLGFTETGTFDRETQRFTLRHVTNVFGERVDLGGTFWCEPNPSAGPDACLRIGDLAVEAHIPLVGGLVERAVETNIHKGWDENAAWLRKVVPTL